MQRNLRIVDQDQLMAVLPDLLDAGAEVPLIISGNSMYPFLKHNRDTVYLSKPNGQPAVGDLVLYRRRHGELVLHRVISAENGSLTMLGDRQVTPEEGISRDVVLAVVNAVRRNGKLIRQGDPVWVFFAKRWLALVRFRPRLIQLYAILTGDKEFSRL